MSLAAEVRPAEITAAAAGSFGMGRERRERRGRKKECRLLSGVSPVVPRSLTQYRSAEVMLWEKAMSDLIKACINCHKIGILRCWTLTLNPIVPSLVR